MENLKFITAIDESINKALKERELAIQLVSILELQIEKIKNIFSKLTESIDYDNTHFNGDKTGLHTDIVLVFKKEYTYTQFNNMMDKIGMKVTTGYRKIILVNAKYDYLKSRYLQPSNTIKFELKTTL